ncbi:MAG TPA: T9SS type A sorting domain-containing protein, partial [bacterium]|nr:T9SS type A sorting domain-containing protein [bacterium]
IITALTNVSANENELFTLQVVANDPDGDALTYSLTEYPEGMEISATDSIRWTPGFTQSGDYTVNVKVTDGRGGETTVSFSLTVIDVPNEYCMNNPFPNPFKQITTIEYSLPKETYVLIAIYNISGQAVCVLKDEVQSIGYYSIKWNAKDMPSGQYFCNFKSKKFTKTKKMVLVK